jgi:phosphate/sulfate permease
MEHFYLVIVIILFFLAISDLIVGVSNDAVNFLNSAIGSKVAPFRIIMFIAAIGILLGATFSSGMMEVARNGIMNPSAFAFDDIIIIFLAVMITDVLLLDLFNTFGLPTSTTVSVVFELLGASVGMGIVKIKASAQGITGLGQYINSERSLLIITGILLSVAISFIAGLIIQYIVRTVFSFNYKNSIRYFGALWGGLAITGIIYFILIKGAKGSSFVSKEQITWISEHSAWILGISFIALTALFQLLYWLFRINILKVIVLFGTFALAMAFAGNDLVNFMGVPLAGYESFKVFSAQNVLTGSEFNMTALAESVRTPTGFLLIAGIIMALALRFSKKARTVTRTEVNLGNQDLINERFSSSPISRSLVRIGVQFGSFMWNLYPHRLKDFLNDRFDDKSFKKQVKKDKGLSFDLVRASVNLAVSSSLIAFATSYKLPLSTTYVTFMVAMSTSLADRAWGRESAVYRISGVVTVIGGWFITAFVAFTMALLIALFLSWGGPAAVIILMAIVIAFIYRTHIIHKKREEVIQSADKDFWGDENVSAEMALTKYNNRIAASLSEISELYKSAIEGLIGEKRKKLAKTGKEIRKLRKEIKSYKKNAHNLVYRLDGGDLADNGEYYFQMLEYMSEAVHCINYIAEPSFTHVDNNHEPLHSADADDLKEFLKDATKYISKVHHFITTGKMDKPEKENETVQELYDALTKMRKNHLKRFKSGSISSSVSLLYLDILSESKNLIIIISSLSKKSRIVNR